MSTGLFGIGTSALLASQRALSVTSNNIANVNTEGYSRQTVEFVEREPTFVGRGFVGKGVDATSARRAFDQFNSDRLTAAITSTAQQETVRDLGSEIDQLLANERAGLQASLDRFYDALGDFATDPADTAVRRAVLTEAASLEQNIISLNTRLDELRDRANGEIRSLVTDINQRTEALAALNAEIIGSGQAVSNQLLDQRDQQVRELSEVLGVSSIARDDGTLDIFVGTGQPLVVGSVAQPLSVETISGDPRDLDVVLSVPGGASVSLSDRLGGGRLAGLLEFQNRILNPAQNALGRVAIATADSFNAQNRLGVDLNGDAGTDIFRPLNSVAPRSFFGQENTGDATLDVAISDVSALTDSDYVLRYDGTDYTVTRSRDGVVQNITAQMAVDADSDGNPDLTATFDGVTIALDESAGAIAGGDVFFIQPTRNAAGAFRTQMVDPSNLAAANPLRVADPLSNTGTGAVDVPEMTEALPSTFASITLTFDSATNTFAYDNGLGGTGTIAFDPATDSGGVAFSGTDVGSSGFDFTLRGQPADGDTFTIERNTGATGDNGNALRLEALRFTPVFGGTASVGEAFSELVAEVGTRVRQASISADAGNARLDAARTAFTSLSGVNLEEEATNLLQQQRSFEAAARIIAVANETFQTLLNSVS
jgi:flagellar hook-associated protein 1 FlgK